MKIKNTTTRLPSGDFEKKNERTTFSLRSVAVVFPTHFPFLLLFPAQFFFRLFVLIAAVVVIPHFPLDRNGDDDVDDEAKKKRTREREKTQV